MPKAVRAVSAMFILVLICLTPPARALEIGGTSGRGCFQGTLAYQPEPDGRTATLTIELTNTTPRDHGGSVTGVFLNNPGGKISAATLSDSSFVLLGKPVFRNGIDASPAGYFDIGAAMKDIGEEAAVRSAGITAGRTGSFRFVLSGTGLDGLDAYSFVGEMPEGGNHFLAVRFDGLAGQERQIVPASRVSDPETVVSPAAGSVVPQHYALMPNYPNPFNPSTNIGFQIPSGGHVSLTIYDVLGRTVRHLLDGRQEAGSYTALWNGRDDHGRELKSGVYFCVMEAGSCRETIKMVLSR